MPRRFRKHYTRDEARELIPQLREWLKRLHELREWIKLYDTQSENMLHAGDDLGGNRVNEWVVKTAEFKQTMQEFSSREIQVKEIERGLLDFPTLIGGKEAFLCWEKHEDDVTNWHELDTDNSGSEPL
ncbi:MAG: DUF2203 family protein [Limisphaerales bacterium]